METKINKIIVHVGPWKTGSSAIQAFLGLNRTKLESFGILYPLGLYSPDVHDEIPKLIQGRHNTTSNLIEEENLSAHRILSSYTGQLDQLHLHTLLLSSENFAGFNSEDYSNFSSILRDLGICKIEVIYFDFTVQSRFNSYKNQIIRHGDYFDTDAANLLFEEVNSLTRKFEIATQNHDLTVKRINYQSLRHDDEIYQKFLETAIGSPLGFIKNDWILPNHRINISLPQPYVNLMNEFNKFNAGDRKYDSAMSLVYSKEDTDEKSRFLIFYEVIIKLAERDNAIAERDNAIAERDNAIAERDNAIAEREKIQNSRTWRAFRFYRFIRR
jgi:hypothetical protein